MSLPPIYVVSKGRPEGPTFAALKAADLPFYAVVEPQDMEAYKHLEGPNTGWLRLPADDQGLGYARQHVLCHARDSGAEWFWMLDDDIRGFYRAHDRKCHPADAREVLEEATAAITADDFVGQGALEYQQFAWSNEPGKVSRISYCDVAVLIRTSVMADYRPELVPKEDRDFTLQVLATGMDTLRTGWLAFGAPANGSNQGGLYDVYAQDGREETASRRLAAMWPGIVEFKRKANGRPDAKIHWKRMRKT